MTITIRNLEREHLSRVAQIHIRAFQDRALSSLGEEAVRRYYEWQLTGPHDAIAIGAFEEGNLLGFCFAGVFRGALSGFLRKNRGFLFTRLILRPWLLMNPLIRERVAQTLKILRKPSRPVSVHNPVPQRSFGILAIAVDPTVQRKGVGQILMEESERVALERGFPQMHLTVATDNHKAVAFYEKLGWKKMLDDGKWEGRMIKEL
ncbi:GNAT family N-acetyltransferase [Anaerolinea sp.]|uniref:GNAT family N-acetyltransferase n=1 Tax=Anaerolinea sp. TaxID=1872519 RepID=UPI002ACE6CE5|nr:GNAT family N-acetyltransferase [Anaerolinea sp.]